MGASDAAGPRKLSVAIGNFFFRYRNYVFPVCMVGLMGGFRPVYAGGDEWADLWVDALGVAIALVGQLLRAVVIGYAYIKRGGKDRRVYANRLVTEGFFNHCRNPLYVGNILMYLGLFVIHNSPWVYALGVPFVLFVYITIVAAEEAYLRDKFGEEYEAYAARVPRWALRLRGLSHTLEGMRFNWRKLVAKEYGSTYVWTVCALLLLLYERRTRPQWLLVAFAVCFAALTLAWAAARHLKKSGRLRQARNDE